jgi:hypothetical protein
MRELRPSVLAGLAPSAAALVVGMVLGSVAPPAGPPGPGGGGVGAYEGGGIKVILKECGLALAPSMVYVNGHSYVAHIGGDAADNVTGSFELHYVPPGTYDLVLVTPNCQTSSQAFRWSRSRSPT